MLYCIVHEGYERCACGERMTWCENWDGNLDEDQRPSCRFTVVDEDEA